MENASRGSRLQLDRGTPGWRRLSDGPERRYRRSKTDCARTLNPRARPVSEVHLITLRNTVFGDWRSMARTVDSDSALWKLVMAIAARDSAAVTGFLAAFPQLATASFHSG